MTRPSSSMSRALLPVVDVSIPRKYVMADFFGRGPFVAAGVSALFHAHRTLKQPFLDGGGALASDLERAAQTDILR